LGGVAKGLLRAPASQQTLVERALGELRAALPAATIALVGDATAYAALGLRAVADSPTGVGPLGGLVGLLEAAERERFAQVLVLACDLPFVERALLTRLLVEATDAAALVTTTGGVRNPLIARYAVARTLPAARAVLQAGRRSLQAVLDELGDELRALTLSDAELASLQDWDTAEDIRRTSEP
jgi:molybdopterin-guanine dinucleotide biosynthesis protein A